jgi:P-type Cu2+ transporter
MSDTALDAGLFVRGEGDAAHLDLVVESMHCAGCMQKIERGLGALPGITNARCNLSTKRVAVSWDAGETSSEAVIAKLDSIGFSAVPFDPKLVGAIDETEASRLLRAMGIAGFAAANVMLLSVSVWSGLVSDMELETRGLFHWLSALIALPAVAYAGRPFFESAWAALKVRTTNMDVPISLAVLLACTMSLVQTIQNAEHVYFDASITLLFFLLIGRYLDVQTRAKACSVAQNLLALRAVAATLVEADGTTRAVPVDSLEPGMIVSIAAGQRLPADGIISQGTSDIDTSLVTGESLPTAATVGTSVYAGTLNLSGPLLVEVTAKDDASLLSEIVRLMEAAEQGRAGYVRLADRIARKYAPTVHALAAATLLLWIFLGAGWQVGLMNAIAVLIITCPCALGLAVPVVQVVASGRLLKQGVLVKAPDALERLAQIDTIVFDKTGTLTLGEPELTNAETISPDALALATALARQSNHPLARAVINASHGDELSEVANVTETPGFGLEAECGAKTVRLGSRKWTDATGPDAAGPELWLRIDSEAPIQFTFADTLREDAKIVVKHLSRTYNLVLLSGDQTNVTKSIASELGIENWAAEQTPADKIAKINAMTGAGNKILMVGDGLNDAPALKAAHVSMSPASAADISQTAADFVFQGAHLGAVADTIQTATRSRSLVFQNFGLALGYNLIAVPLAVMGFVTPLIAAVDMSSSSLIVTLNALRLGIERFQDKWQRLSVRKREKTTNLEAGRAPWTH